MVTFRGLVFTSAIILFLNCIFLSKNLPNPKVETKSLDKKPETFKWNLGIFFLLTATFLVQAVNNAVSPYIAFFVQEISRNTGGLSIGLSVSATGIMTFLTARSLGKLVDRYSAALILFAMLTLGGFSLFLSSIADSLFIFIMSRAIFGISDAGVNPAIEVQITKMTKPNQLNRSFSYIQSAQSVGVAVGPFIGAFLNTHGGYQLVFSSVSGLYWVLIIAIIVFYLLRRKSD